MMGRIMLVSFAAALFWSSSALTTDERPVQKVIRLLKEMKSNMEAESDQDKETYDTMACWCETNEKAKTKAVADGISLDKKLTALIPELAATSAGLKVEIKQLQKELKENQESLAESTEMRAKELGEFRAEETDGVASITGMKNAIGALSRPSAALSQEVFLQVKQAVGRKSGEQLRKLAQYRKATNLQGARGSGEILGIMKGMQESFQQNMETAKTEEAEALATFKQTKAAKEQEIKAAIKQIQNKQVELSDTDEKNADSKETLDDTRKQVTADNAFLRDLQQRCGTMDKQYADRQKVRAQEMLAVGEALKILTDDDATDLFAKTSSFVQLKASAASSRRSGALALLRAAGKQLANPRLIMLSMTLKDDVFTKIKVVLDDLVENLHNEQKDEVDQKDSCVDDLNSNEKSLAQKNRQSKDASISIEEYTITLNKLRDELAAAKAEIEDTKKEMLLASENREKENKDFQTTLTDQRATQQIVTKALDKLKSFYDAASLVQIRATTKLHSSDGQAPPQGFAPAKKQEGAGGVTGMMEHIIEESKEVEADAVKAEREAQAAYEQFQKDSNDAIESLTKSIKDKQKQAGESKAEKLRADEDLKSLTADIEGLKGFRRQLRSQCDFLIKNFEVRQAARSSEMEALEEAKAMMNGAA